MLLLIYIFNITSVEGIPYFLRKWINACIANYLEDKPALDPSSYLREHCMYLLEKGQNCWKTDRIDFCKVDRKLSITCPLIHVKVFVKSWNSFLFADKIRLFCNFIFILTWKRSTKSTGILKNIICYWSCISNLCTIFYNSKLWFIYILFFLYMQKIFSFVFTSVAW